MSLSDDTPRRGVRRGIRETLVLVAALVAMPPARADDFLTEARFDASILEPISATVLRTEAREFLRRISAERDVAIVLDCRVDPHQLRDIAWVELSLVDAIESFAADIGAATSIVGDTIIMGPPESIRNLRTLIALRFDELEQLPGITSRRITQLRRKSELVWQDLDRPGDLIHSIAESAGLHIENTEIIPHDLWAGAAIANANAVEQLSIVLMQLDLAFEWGERGDAIRLVPCPVEVAVVREHEPRGVTIEEAEAAVRAEFPSLAIDVDGRQLAAAARIEEHERIEELLGIREPRDPQPVPSVPLARRTFTLTVVNQPVGAVLQALVDQGVPIEFDAEQLTNDGADLSIKISLQLREARIEDLMEELCEPAGLAFEVEGETVRLGIGDE